MPFIELGGQLTRKMEADLSTNVKGAATPSVEASAKSANGVNVPLVTAVLDFIGKCFYPAIVIALLIILRPALEQIDLKGLASRLLSAKVAGTTFEFSEDVGAQTAPLNGKVAELDRVIDTLKKEVGALQAKVGQPQVDEPARKAQELAEQRFQANGKYTALVFHQKNSRSAAESVTSALLKAGYTSSDTETNFAELQKVDPTPGVIFITYTAKGAEALSDVKGRIASLGFKAEVKVNPRAIELRRGDLQISVF